MTRITPERVINPLYYDQLTGIYNHWTVISSKMTIVVQRVSNPVQVQCVLLLDDDASLGTSNNINLLTERAGAVFGAADPGNGLLLTLSKTWSARKWFGANPLDNDNLKVLCLLVLVKACTTASWCKTLPEHRNQ